MKFIPRIALLGIGAICTWMGSLVTPQMMAADVAYYSVAKGILFNQPVGVSTPTIRSGLPYAFQAVVQPPTNLITSARVQWSFADLALSPITTPSALGFVQRVQSQDLLDGTFPNGEFRVVAQTVNDGAHTGTLQITGNNYPSPPTVQNLSAAQSINPSLPFTLNWSSFVGGTPNDFIYVQIENSQGRAFASGAYPGAVGALSGVATSAVIPANSLQPGHAYIGRIVFYRFGTLNTSDYPGALGTGGYFSQTDFYVSTVGGGDTTPPTLLSTEPANGATGVPINSPVTFNFSETMSRGFALGISGTTAPRTFDWSPDSKVLVATPTTNWPANTTITLTLNLYYTQLAFGDTNANPLPMETVLTFTTGSNVASNTPPILTDPKRLPNGRFQVTVNGTSNLTYTVQASTNLILWTPLATNIAFQGSFDFLDTNAPAIPNRFYRALSR